MVCEMEATGAGLWIRGGVKRESKALIVGSVMLLYVIGFFRGRIFLAGWRFKSKGSSPVGSILL